jgi:hypothetical protein
MTTAQLFAADQRLVEIYVVGLFGSLAVEVSSALKQTLELHGACPPLYKKPFYLVIRVIFAFFIAAPLPIIFDATSWVAALYMSASAPIILDRLASGIGRSVANNLATEAILPGSSSQPQ